MNIFQKISSRPFYISMPIPCPYIEGQIEQKVFMEITQDFTEEELTLLTASGFRRNNNIIYKQNCAACQKCVPLRIPVFQFKFGKSAKRLFQKYKNLVPKIEQGITTAEDFILFKNYQRSRHPESEMVSISFDEYREMIELELKPTKLLKFYDEDEVRAIMLYDETLDGYSAIYSFFDTQDESHSYGKFLIYKLIELAKKQNKPYVYLGYWIKECRKMSYKGNFTPLEILGNEGWELKKS